MVLLPDNAEQFNRPDHKTTAGRKILQTKFYKRCYKRSFAADEKKPSSLALMTASSEFGCGDRI
jgi:hypothetical protein